MTRDFLNCLNSKQSEIISDRQETWKRIAFAIEPLDRQKTVKAVKDFYNLNGEKEPDVIVCDSPWQAIWQLINRSSIDLYGDRSYLLHPTTLNYQIFDYESKILKQNKNDFINIDSEIHWDLVRSITSPIESVKAILLEQLCQQLENRIYYEFVSEYKSQKKTELVKKCLPIADIASRIISDGKYYIDRWELFSKIKRNDYKLKKDPRVKYQRIIQIHDRLTSWNYFEEQNQPNILFKTNAAVIDFKISVFNLPVINLKAWQLFKSLAENCYLIFPFENVCLVSDRPRKLCFDDDNRLHAENETAIEFADGWFCEYFESGNNITERVDRVYISEEEKIAADFNTPAATLRKLADTQLAQLTQLGNLQYTENRLVLSAVASNPNTPPDLLLNLAANYPGKVLNNPAMPLLLLENPNFINEVIEILYAAHSGYGDYYSGEEPFFYYAKVPDLFWEYVLKYPDGNIRAFIAETFKIKTSFLEKFAADKNLGVRDRVASRHDTPLFILERLAKDKNVKVRLEVAINRKTSADILEELARDKNVKLRLELARNRNIFGGILNILAIDNSIKVRLEIARKFSINTAILELLARDRDREVRLEVARNRKTSVAILELLARDEDREVRLKAVKNSNFSGRISKQLARDEYIAVRRQVAIAIKDNSPEGILEQLARDENAAVRCQVANNNNTSQAILELLARDENGAVRYQVANNNNTPTAILEQLATDTNVEVRRMVAANRNTPTAILEQLSIDTNVEVRLTIAHNRNSPTAILKELANDTSLEVRRMVAANRNSPTAILKELANDINVEVRCSIARNINTPGSVLEQLSIDTNVEVRRAIAHNRNTPGAVLEQLANDKDPYVLYELGANSNTPPEIKKQLEANDIVNNRLDNIPF